MYAKFSGLSGLKSTRDDSINPHCDNCFISVKLHSLEKVENERHKLFLRFRFLFLRCKLLFYEAQGILLKAFAHFIIEPHGA